MKPIHIAFFDAKPYDMPAFEEFGGRVGIRFKYFETKLSADTVSLAKGFDGVCAFVNDTLDREVMERLEELASPWSLSVARASIRRICAPQRIGYTFCAFPPIRPTPWPSMPWPCF